MLFSFKHITRSDQLFIIVYGNSSSSTPCTIVYISSTTTSQVHTTTFPFQDFGKMRVFCSVTPRPDSTSFRSSADGKHIINVQQNLPRSCTQPFQLPKILQCLLDQLQIFCIDFSVGLIHGFLPLWFISIILAPNYGFTVI